MPQSGGFPADFLWGTATAAYQIEGAVREDGRGASIWDTFSHTLGKIADGANGDVACDHYHRWRDDIKLMQEIGIRSYRLSIAWPRVMPSGSGALNQQGLDFYERVIEGLLEAGITPAVTLYHWDLPQTLQNRGGWPARATAETFANYADTMVRRLGDRVQRWITHNEPWCTSMLGHLLGEHAPGERDLGKALAAAHHVLLSHGLATQAIRATNSKLEVGITLNLTPGDPASDREADQQATQTFDGFFNRWFLDPLAGRGYPQDMQTLYGAAMPQVEPNDLAVIATPTDFLGINYYTRAIIAYDANEPLQFAQRGPEKLRGEGAEITEMGWEVYPQGLGDLLLRVHREYGPKTLYVTENGAAFADEVGADGQVHDPARTRYLHAHFAEAERVIQAGVPLRGYYVWSLMDNFEWAFGYTKRFGITYVDYTTQERILKDSGRWYQEVIAENANVEPR
ncbi:MAG: beta-glucosidase [Herpetosiphonaceae bacterium]|nr:beta-glucosidase [Herpetosiphonaceae bacterium]